MINALGLTEVGLEVFGGDQLDMQATDVPQGLSPSTSDIAFLPGSFFTRPPLARLRAIGNSQCVYHKTFLRPDGTVTQLQMMADGRMYQNGALFGQTNPGNRFVCCNAFGKMYIAISDGQHGADVPLQLTPEGWLDRVSQDGPGAPPTLTNYILPPVALTAGSAGVPVTITNATPIDPQQVQTGGGNDDGGGYIPPQYETYYTAILFDTASPHGMTAGQAAVIAGNSLYSLGTVAVLAVPGPTSFTVSAFQQSPSVGTGGTATPLTPLLVRTNNLVTGETATPHNLRPGYKFVISGIDDATQAISSIVIDNDTLSGEATVTTSGAHFLVPGEQVKIANVSPANVGTFASGNVTDKIGTFVFTAAHHLEVGVVVYISTNGGPAYPQTVTAAPTPTTITWDSTQANTSFTSGTVTLPWPFDSGQTFTIDSVPAPDKFTFAMTYSGGTWNSGNLQFAWNGTFYVTSVPSATSFTYAQAGPNAALQSGTGTVTPSGQISPGRHACVVIFLTRTGYLTIPSPPVTITASGGQYLFVSNIPLGPSNVVARWLAFTGADGGNYFVLPIPPRDPSAQYAVGTATTVPDNSTTSAIIDFADESLFAGFAIDIPGNNLFRQQVLGPCLGFFAYGSRLFSWGERNKVQLFRNMGFEGGIYAAAPNSPLGWTVSGSDGILTAGDYGLAWQATTATISQTAYQNSNGTAIIEPNTRYTYRAWVNGRSIATLSSATTGFLSTATIGGAGNFAEADFSATTPLSIPSDLIITFSQTSLTTVDEAEIIYRDDPYLLQAKGSYLNNPEAIDGVTGPIGPASDPHPILGMEERKDILCLLTAGPEGSLYETQQTASGEPATWEINHRAAKCGLTSVWGAAKFEDWFCWTSDTGLRIFDGANVEKMSQEIQPWWNSINPTAKQFTVLANDPYTRRVYISAAVNGANVCNSTRMLDYRDLNTAGQLANAGTLHVGYTGKVVTTDLTRKWSLWSMAMNFIGLLTLPDGEAVMAFSGGDGVSLSNALYGATYELVEGSISGVDADYGPYWQNCYYQTYFLLSDEEKAQLQLGRHRLFHAFASMNVTGIGKIYLLPSLDRIGNYGKVTRPLLITEDMARDLEFGLNEAAERISYKIACQPDGLLPAPADAQAGFRVSSLQIGLKTHGFSPVRGLNRG